MNSQDIIEAASKLRFLLGINKKLNIIPKINYLG